MTIEYSILPLIPCPVCESLPFREVTRRFDTGPLVRCEMCGHYYLNPPLSNEQLSAIYAAYFVADSDADQMHIIEGWFHDPRGPYQYVLNLVARQDGLRGSRVLEVGCGPGRLLSECQRCGAMVTGVDMSPAAVRLAKRYLALELIPTTLERAVVDGSVSAETFDMIFAFETIEHVRKPGEFLRLLHGLLRPGGRLVLSTPNFHLFSLLGEAAPAVRQWPEHLHFFTPSTFTQCLTSTHFLVNELTTVAPMTASDRQKHRLGQKGLIRTLWRLARRLPLIVTGKDIAFRLLDRRQEKSGSQGWDGTCLIGIAQKPMRATA